MGSNFCAEPLSYVAKRAPPAFGLLMDRGRDLLIERRLMDRGRDLLIERGRSIGPRGRDLRGER